MIIWANCQGYLLYQMLSKICPSEYYINYKFINEKLDLPNFTTDIFISQKYDGHRGTIYEYQKIIDSLPESCLKINFPFIMFKGYWPYEIRWKPALSSYKCSKHPFGLWGSLFLKDSSYEYLIKEIRNHIDDKSFRKKLYLETCVKVLDDSYIRDISSNLESSLEILREKEQSTDIRISQYIRENYTKRLFHHSIHPDVDVLNKVYSQIFDKINLPYVDLLHHQDDDYPVSPIVGKTLGLTFNLDGKHPVYGVLNYDSWVKQQLADFCLFEDSRCQECAGNFRKYLCN